MLMPRAARIVVPGVPHHVIQRGNRRQDVFFSDEDYRMYLSLLKEKCTKAGTNILAYCLMHNHVHLILRPAHEEGLRIVGEAHRLYTRYINRKMGWQGYLWQGRFGSYPMDEPYFYRALRYVELNPVRAGLCDHPCAYRWSSARQRAESAENTDLKVEPAGGMVDDWEAYWLEGLSRYQETQKIEDNLITLTPQIPLPATHEARGETRGTQ